MALGLADEDLAVARIDHVPAQVAVAGNLGTNRLEVGSGHLAASGIGLAH